MLADLGLVSFEAPHSHDDFLDRRRCSLGLDSDRPRQTREASFAEERRISGCRRETPWKLRQIAELGARARQHANGGDDAGQLPPVRALCRRFVAAALSVRVISEEKDREQVQIVVFRLSARVEVARRILGIMRRSAFVLRKLPDLKKLLLLSRLRPLIAAFRVELGPEVEIEGRVWIPGTGRVHFGRGVRLRGRRAPIELRAHDGAEIRLGDAVVVDAGASIEATERVEVGARASIGSFAKIIDNHYHRTVGDRDARPVPTPISIGDDAVVGPRAILLPGARVRSRAVVGAGQVLPGRRRG